MENNQNQQSKFSKITALINNLKNKCSYMSFGMITIALVVFLATAAWNNISEINFRKNSYQTSRLITFRGTAEVSATPDVAIFNFTIRESQNDVAKAQQKMTEKTNNLIAVFAELGIEKKDIQTSNYSTYPKYNYVAPPCVKGICPAGKQVLEGYEATQTLTVKLRDNTKASEILTKAAALEVTEVFGPNFTIEDPAKYRLQAQAQAIEKAKSEAEVTAKNLGVKLGKIVRFQEEPFHNFASRPMLMKSSIASDSVAESASPNLEAGEEKISISVSLTYEIE